MDIIKKLNIKEGQKELTILNAPESFAETVAEFRESYAVSEAVNTDIPYDFVLVFAVDSTELREYASLVLPNIKPESLVWFAYPKRTSKKYKSDISRDIGWDQFGGFSMEPVRQIAIDDDWTALRFRPAKDYDKDNKTLH